MKRNQYYRPSSMSHMKAKRSHSGEIIIAQIVVIALLVIFAASAKACDEVYIGAWSYHINSDKKLNETHYLLACEKNGYIAGGIKNSYGDPAALAGKGFDLFELGDFKSTVYVGATYGYYGCDNKDNGGDRSICPMVIPELSYTKYRFKPAVVIMGNAVAVTFKVGF